MSIILNGIFINFLMPATMNLPNGTLLQGGKYRTDGVLGKGGFGITYRATHMALGTQVAIKEFFLNGVNDRGGDLTSVSVSNRDNEALFNKPIAKNGQQHSCQGL